MTTCAWSFYSTITEEKLGWQQKVLCCSHMFLHSLIFWIKNALHLLICNIFIQKLVFWENFGVGLAFSSIFLIFVLKTWYHLIVFGAIWLYIAQKISLLFAMLSNLCPFHTWNQMLWAEIFECYDWLKLRTCSKN